jgi:hypothetical protein
LILLGSQRLCVRPFCNSVLNENEPPQLSESSGWDRGHLQSLARSAEALSSSTWTHASRRMIRHGEADIAQPDLFHYGGLNRNDVVSLAPRP